MDIDRLFSVKGMNAVVLGASSGIGKAIAEMFSEMGGKVVLSDIDEEGLKRLSDSLRSRGHEVNHMKCDITDLNQVKKLVNFSLSVYGNVDALYVTPSINVRKSIENYTYEDFEKVINVNLKGNFMVVKEFLSVMKNNKGGGSVVLFSSIRGTVVEPGQSVYAMTKAGIIQLAKVAAAEYGKYNIRVNVIAPGVVDTPLTRQIKSDPEWFKAYTEKTILKRWATPEEIANVALFLAMPASSYITGTVIYVDGGWTAIDGRYDPKV
ncbi:SDR family NAD(P)-dependent oxidoreductase [Sulfolobus acidocaldarius]|uniref:Oxidoreductase n=4 Tax=Sulfolobus acidocaldarius TaxID=2285 RepID=Q4J702_SULAC|nr:SDR family oxidoreductase [Sulfolobus acidocaldarius]AAY81423.1 oxidoreductase [Sulfolobus acidocaldarius DSM 639]AGE72023.1 oxidoreductase [Sulfolobus acidocaldarius N8]AGE74340.1 oxidoreductase [Sulfolobus acidocaldarius Ron12/I]ALU29787.1 3-oxoacyl-ACP reductase [Sulfolobus acidocaldarius]ALU32525.1 3-oxoacyl-ACP reductase [Sulfolobus acidocaldarius]